MVELRSFAFIDRLQKQIVGFVGANALGYYPVAGQAAVFIEIAPGIEINSLTNSVMKKSGVMPGAMVVERTYGLLEVHADSPSDVEMAGQVALEHLGVSMIDRLKPKILSSVIVERLDPHMSQIINRFRNSNMSLGDETLYILEMVPAGYAGFAANEAEKSADVRLLHVTVFGASGRLYLSGSSSDVHAAKIAVEASLAALDGKDH